MTPPSIPPVIEVFFSAFSLAENETAPEIGLDHLLTALDGPRCQPSEEVQSSGPHSPVPHEDKPFSNEASAAIEAACAQAGCDAQHLTIDALRAAVLAAQHQDTG